MKIFLYILLCLPFWSAATAEGKRIEFCKQALSVDYEQTDERTQLNCENKQFLKEYKYSRRRRISSAPICSLPLDVFKQLISKFFQQRLLKVQIKGLEAVLPDVAHCYRMTPF